jgi:hypothetical protein
MQVSDRLVPPREVWTEPGPRAVRLVAFRAPKRRLKEEQGPPRWISNRSSVFRQSVEIAFDQRPFQRWRRAGILIGHKNCDDE